MEILEAARMETPWLSGSMERPSLEGCDAMPAAGGVVDNTSARVFSEGTRAVETEREARMRRFTGG